MSTDEVPFDPAPITRPDPALLRYYVLVSLVATLAILPLSVIVFIPLYFKYHTLRYRFDDEGILMSWGVLFRREINLTYRRIQDIHVTRNLFQRWMGLATVAIQTASGSATPEMSIEGILHPDALRDHLYARMRGAKGDAPNPDTPTPPDDTLALLHDIRDELAMIRQRLDRPGDAP